MRATDLIVSALVCLIVLSALFAPLLARSDPLRIDLDSILESPSPSHIFGTDTKGRDIYARVIHGGRISLGVALVAAVFAMGIGLVLGLIAGYAGGKTDLAIVAMIDFVLSFPSLLLAIGISVVLPPGVYTVMIAITVVGWASFARLVRGHVLTLRNMTYVDAARALGCSHGRIILRHLLPQCVSLGIVMMGLKLSGFIITEASLSFLGLGPQPPAPSWGGMISAGRAYILSAPWLVVFPGIAIALSALCFNLLGDILRERYGDEVR